MQVANSDRSNLHFGLQSEVTMQVIGLGTMLPIWKYERFLDIPYKIPYIFLLNCKLSLFTWNPKKGAIKTPKVLPRMPKSEEPFE